MKKFIFLLFCFFYVSFSQAQFNPSYYGFRLGLTAHPNFGMIAAEEGKSNGTNPGFVYGLIADVNFAEHYSFYTGLTVTSINGKSTEINAMPYHAIKSSIAPVAYDLKYKMQYIEIPLALKLKTSQIGEVKWFGQFGLSNGFRIRARQDVTEMNRELAYDANSASWTRFYRAGLLIGGGAEYDLDTHTSLVAGLTFNKGLTNINTAKAVVRNHYLALNIGVFF